MVKIRLYVYLQSNLSPFLRILIYVVIVYFKAIFGLNQAFPERDILNLLVTIVK